MNPGPRTLRPNVPRSELEDLFRRHTNLDHVIITTLAGELLGIVRRPA